MKKEGIASCGVAIPDGNQETYPVTHGNIPAKVYVKTGRANAPLNYKNLLTIME
jgi:hypothetical protein